jgi:ferric-dicitrate binding protein FerR (iron transport regulator)
METNIPYHLIASQLDGSISDADKIVLDAWLNENAQNRAIFDEQEKMWTESGQVLQQFSPDAHVALGKVHSRLNLDDGGKTIHLKSHLPLMLKIAAGLALIIVSGYLYFNLRTPTLIIAESNIYEKLELTTDDGTKIMLNKGSKLTYPEHFRGKERKVKLEGEAFFEVAKDSVHPFIIEALGSQTKVLGTKFDLKAYNNDSLIVINLVEGKVDFSNTSNLNHVILTAGEKAIMNCRNGSVYKQMQESKNFESWKSDTLIFENAELASVIKELSEYYNKKIVLNDTNLRKLRLYGTFNNQSLTEVSKAIEEALNLQFVQNGNTIEVSSK